MKKVILSILLLCTFTTSLSAYVVGDQPLSGNGGCYNVVDENGKEIINDSTGEPLMVCEESIGGQKDDHGCLTGAGYSWDESLNICIRSWEKASGIYSSAEDFLKVEGNSCKVATDGCNTVQIWGGELGAMTQMYCEDVYGESGQEQWQCLDQKMEDEQLGFMTNNEKNQYKHMKEKVLDAQTQEKIMSVLDNFSTRVLEKSGYDTQRSIKILSKAVNTIDDAIFEISMSYPADVGMSKKDTQIYNILTFAKYELGIIKYRWERNSGIR